LSIRTTNPSSAAGAQIAGNQDPGLISLPKWGIESFQIISKGFLSLMGLLNISFPWQIQAKRRQPSSAGGNVQKSPSSKAAALLTRGAYMEYVSTAKWRERRWRLFSTFP
jgi:hypothetical protein